MVELLGSSSDAPKPFDISLLEPTEKIPDGNASSIAVMNYATRVLQL